jgi:vancomycin resistance protein VanW
MYRKYIKVKIMPRKRLTQIFPVLLPIRIKQRKMFFKLKMKMDGRRYSVKKCDERLPVRIFKYKSLLLRKLGETDMQLQKNKVVNLKIAASKISGVLIKPGETFSLWKLVGDISYKEGYLDGIYLSDGQVKIGVGGGLCQLANLLFWIFLHTELEIIERYRHGFDPFPDYGRVIPFGTGATLVDGWKDLKMKNNSDRTYQINIWFDDEYIYGDITTDSYPKYVYHIKEVDHRFVKKKDCKIYRQNKIYKETVIRKSGNLEKSELLFENDCEIKYALEDNMFITE